MLKRFNLFCFPYAGATSSFFFRWKTFLPEYINVIPVELAGRGSRMCEAFYPDFDAAITDLSGKLEKQIRERPFLFFGHSMGSWLAYELASYFEYNTPFAASHLFLSGRIPPHLCPKQNMYTAMTNEEFILDLKKKGGIFRDIFDLPDFKSIFLPVLRADFNLLESYDFSDRGLLSAGITFLYSNLDMEIDRKRVSEWNQYTKGLFTICDFIGDHFYLLSQPEKIAALIRDTAEVLSN